MSGQSTSVYSSAPFKFVFDGEPLYIHADLVALHSKPLERMMNGPMVEAQEGSATLKDVDRDTFVRFIEWAHRGFYTPAKFTTIIEEEALDAAGSATEGDYVAEYSAHEPDSQPFPYLVREDEIIEGHEEPEMWGGFGGRVSKKNKTKKGIHSPDHPGSRTRREELWQAFKSRARKSAVEPRPTRRNQNAAEVYSEVFLSHARLYVFADEYDIQPLKFLALDELHATLVDFSLYRKRTGDVIDLLRYVYANTCEPREGAEDMRTLVTQYVGYQMDTLIDDEDFKELMIKDRGPLLGDFMAMVGKRII